MKIVIKPNTTISNRTGSWRTFRPKIDFSKCLGCGNCSRVCPEGIIVMIEKDNKKKPQINYDYCKGCGLCSIECPAKSMTMEKENK